MDSSYRGLLPHAGFFFLYGAVVHVLLLGVYAGRLHFTGPELLWSLTAFLIVGLAGGLSVAALFLVLLQESRTSTRLRPVGVILSGAIFGVVATFLAAACAVVLGAAVFARHLGPNALINPLPFLLGIIDMATYAMAAPLFAIPAELLYGALGGAYLLALRHRGTPPPEREWRPLDRATLSLVFGALGLLLLLIPYVGLALAALAVVHGLRSHSWSGGPREHSVFGRTGTVIGALCLFYWVYSFAVYQAASFGWLKRR